MFTVTSTRFKKELERRRREFSKPISARLTVPPDLKWWYWHEFGTATRAEPGRGSGQPYRIAPISAKYLSWPDPNSTYGDFVFHREDGVARRFVVKAHPGVRPTHMIRKTLRGIGGFAGQSVVEAMLQSGFKREAVRARLLEYVMPHAKNIIVQSISEHLTGTRADGKLQGQTAAFDFERNATIKET